MRCWTARASTGAYQFELRPGTTTQVQVTAELYPRRADREARHRRR